VVSLEHQGLAFSLLDTPGHRDFRAVGRMQSAAVMPVSCLMRANLLARGRSCLTAEER
jgi:peptide subunit release factor RF-3